MIRPAVSRRPRPSPDCMTRSAPAADFFSPLISTSRPTTPRHPVFHFPVPLTPSILSFSSLPPLLPSSLPHPSIDDTPPCHRRISLHPVSHSIRSTWSYWSSSPCGGGCLAPGRPSLPVSPFFCFPFLLLRSSGMNRTMTSLPPFPFRSDQPVSPRASIPLPPST